MDKEIITIGFHLTNVTGLGAVRLMQSLLPALQKCNYIFNIAYIPDKGELSNDSLYVQSIIIKKYKRYLLQFISRFLECSLFGSLFNKSSHLFVFGDIPLRTNSKQIVFFHSPTIVFDISEKFNLLHYLKLLISKYLLIHNSKFVCYFIVQTEVMKLGLLNLIPDFKNKILVINQPPPHWIISSRLARSNRITSNAKLTFFYPAAFYPHKNHNILNNIKIDDTFIEKIILTIPSELNPIPNSPIIECTNLISPDGIIEYYKKADALMFLSSTESYGLPLVEAMWLGLPIICPDLPYARILCGNNAIYFDIDNPISLNDSISLLAHKFNNGWWPDWSENLKNIPSNWDEVAHNIFKSMPK